MLNYGNVRIGNSKSLTAVIVIQNVNPKTRGRINPAWRDKSRCFRHITRPTWWSHVSELTGHLEAKRLSEVRGHTARHRRYSPRAVKISASIGQESWAADSEEGSLSLRGDEWRLSSDRWEKWIWESEWNNILTQNFEMNRKEPE
jgi:hypothetical protein